MREIIFNPIVLLFAAIAAITLFARVFIIRAYKKYYYARGKFKISAATAGIKYLEAYKLSDKVALKKLNVNGDAKFVETSDTIGVAAGIYENTGITAMCLVLKECVRARSYYSNPRWFRLRKAIYSVLYFFTYPALIGLAVGLIFREPLVLLYFGLSPFAVFLSWNILMFPFDFVSSGSARKIVDESKFLDTDEMISMLRIMTAGDILPLALTLLSVSNLIKMIKFLLMGNPSETIKTQPRS